MAPRTLYYALGGGLGHVARTVALARQLARLRPGAHLLVVNSEFHEAAARLIAQEPRLDACFLAANLEASQVRAEIPDWLTSQRPTHLIVDTFPRGLVGDLVSWLTSASCPVPRERRVLVSRPLPGEYVTSHDLRPFVAENYARVIVPGEPSLLGDVVETLHAPPFLLRDREELPTADAAACQLDVPRNLGAVVIAASGTASEVARWTRWSVDLANQWPRHLPPLRLIHPRSASARSGDAPTDAPLMETSFLRVMSVIPLIDILPAARLVIGAAGYNLTHETRLLGIPAFQAAASRLYDRQATRVRDPLVLDDSRHESGTVASEIQRRLLPDLPVIPAYENGARTAATWLSSFP